MSGSLIVTLRPAMAVRAVLLMLALAISPSLWAQYWTRMPTDAEVQVAAEAFVQDLLTRRQQEPCHLSTHTSQKLTRLHHQTDAAWFMVHLQLTMTTTRQPWASRARDCDAAATPSTSTDDFHATLIQEGQSGRFLFTTTLSTLQEYLGDFEEGWDVRSPPADAAPAAPGRYQATIRVPPLTPGEVLSPSVDVVDENGKPPTDSIYVSWYINGVNTPSMVWDGRETRVEVQVSVANQALVEAVLIPAHAPGGAAADAVPTAPTLTVPDAAAGPVPGMTGVGPLPGPGSLGQALVGTLLPPLLITLGQLLAGVRGGAGVPPLPPKPAAPAASPSAAPPSPPARPSIPPIDPVWKQRLDRLEQVAKHDRNGALTAAVQAVRTQLGGPRDPKAWAAAQQQLKDALGQLDQALPKPNGVGWDAAASVVGGVRETTVQAGGAIRDAGGALAGFPGSVWQGLKGIGNGVLNPGHFVAGVNGLMKDWVSKHLKTESQAFVQGLKDGKLADALGALGQGMVKAAGSALGAAWEKVGKSVLPVDELKSFSDPHASLEEKLWAVPAAAVKIAGILVGLQKPTPQPSTTWGQAIRQGLQEPVPPPAMPVAPKPKLPGPVRARPASVETPSIPAPAPARPAPPPTEPPATAPAPPSPANAATSAPSAPPTPPKKRFFQGAADGSDIEILPPSEITPSNHSSVVGDISLESIHRAEHWRFFKVDRAGIRMLEPGAGVEDLCDVLLPKNKRLADLTDTDIVVCTSDARKAAWIRTQVRKHINQILRG